MQFNLTTDYAIRIIYCLAERKTIVTSHEISEKMGIPQHYVLKIMRNLTAAGLAERFSGIQGGFRIARKKINLYDVTRAVEPKMAIARCMEPDCYCSLGMQETCQLRKFYMQMQKTMDSMLSGKLITDLIQESEQAEPGENPA